MSCVKSLWYFLRWIIGEGSRGNRLEIFSYSRLTMSKNVSYLIPYYMLAHPSSQSIKKGKFKILRYENTQKYEHRGLRTNKCLAYHSQPQSFSSSPPSSSSSSESSPSSSASFTQVMKGRAFSLRSSRVSMSMIESGALYSLRA